MDLTSAPGSKGISKPSAGTALGQPGHKRSSVWEEGLEETRVNHKRKPAGMNRIVTVCISATSDPQLPEMRRFVDISHYRFRTLQDSVTPGESQRPPKVMLANGSFTLGRFMNTGIISALSIQKDLLVNFFSGK